MGEKIKWLKIPELHDYPSAFSYLKLIYSDEKSKEIIELLKESKMTEFKAKDIFRASKESPLGISNSHIKSNLKKIKKGKKLSPLLLVSDSKIGKVIIVDGYHRICTINLGLEDEWVPCKIVYI